MPPSAAASFAVVAMQISLKKKKKEKVQRKRRWWYRQLFQQRLQYGGNRLMKDMHVELVDDICTHFTRAVLEDFEYLASLVCPNIMRTDIQMKEAITAKERLALALRFLATGDPVVFLFSLDLSPLNVSIKLFIFAFKAWTGIPMCALIFFHASSFLIQLW